MLDEQWSFRTEQVAQLTQPGRRETDTERQINRRILTAAWTVLADMQAARERLRDGTYGWCVGCTAPLAIERLRAVPHVAMCDRCQFDEAT
jgi:DnaK suppressor protein